MDRTYINKPSPQFTVTLFNADIKTPVHCYSRERCPGDSERMQERNTDGEGDRNGKDRE